MGLSLPLMLSRSFLVILSNSLKFLSVIWLVLLQKKNFLEIYKYLLILSSTSWQQIVDDLHIVVAADLVLKFEIKELPNISYKCTYYRSHDLTPSDDLLARRSRSPRVNLYRNAKVRSVARWGTARWSTIDIIIIVSVSVRVSSSLLKIIFKYLESKYREVQPCIALNETAGSAALVLWTPLS